MKNAVMIAILCFMMSGACLAQDKGVTFLGIPWGSSPEFVDAKMKEKGYKRGFLNYYMRDEPEEADYGVKQYDDKPEEAADVSYNYIGVFAGREAEISLYFSNKIFFKVAVKWRGDYEKEYMEMLTEKYGKPDSDKVWRFSDKSCIMVGFFAYYDDIISDTERNGFRITKRSGSYTERSGLQITYKHLLLEDEAKKRKRQRAVKDL